MNERHEFICEAAAITEPRDWPTIAAMFFAYFFYLNSLGFVCLTTLNFKRDNLIVYWTKYPSNLIMWYIMRSLQFENG